MTIEQAITEFDNLAEKNERFGESHGSGINMKYAKEQRQLAAWLKELKELREQTSDDCISRQAAIYVASGFCHPSNVAKELAKLPAVTPKTKTGHWITTRTFMHDGEFYCDKCKCESPNNEKWDYCPNCGAKMEV